MEINQEAISHAMKIGGYLCGVHEDRGGVYVTGESTDAYLLMLTLGYLIEKGAIKLNIVDGYYEMDVGKKLDYLNRLCMEIEEHYEDITKEYEITDRPIEKDFDFQFTPTTPIGTGFIIPISKDNITEVFDSVAEYISNIIGGDEVDEDEQEYEEFTTEEEEFDDDEDFE